MTEEQSLSQELRSAREQRGMSVEDVIQETGLSANVVHGLEEDRFDVVEPVFTRMALRTYAEHLELDVEQVLARFNREYGGTPRPRPSVAGPARAPRPSRRTEDHRTFRVLAVIVGALVVLLAVVVLITRVTDSRQAAVPRSAPPLAPRQPPSSPSSEPQSAAQRLESTPLETTRSGVPPDSAALSADRRALSPPALADTAAASSGGAARAEGLATGRQETGAGGSAVSTDASQTRALSEPQTGAAGVDTSAGSATPPAQASSGHRTRPAAVPPDSLLRLAIEAVDTTWVQVDADGRMLFQGLLEPGARRSWQAREQLLVHSGRAHGLRYWFQDELLGNGRLGDSSEVLRFRASRRGITLLDSELQPLKPPPDSTGQP